MATEPDASLPNDLGASGRIDQKVTGDRNLLIGSISGGTAIANIETFVENLQQLPRSPESARYSLPIDPADFTGREDEIQQIEADVRAGLVVAIAGMPGVGKSALAVRVAHRLKAEFPGGQIYLNLRGADTQPLTVDAALETLLRALGVDPAQIPPERADKAALYRSHFAQQPTLVLLDNASDARQVEELLPGAGACLITSRRQLDGLAGIKRLNLEALSEEEALELLEKVLPPERVQAEAAATRAIVGYCGRLPLALRIAAATLAMRSWQGKRLADYAQQLADQRQRLGLLKLEDLDIRASFELSYRELDPVAAHLLGWLGLLPGDFGTAILGALTEEPAEAVQVALATLVDGQLVDPLATDPAVERYLLHDLMRLFALENLEAGAEPAALQAAKVRLVQWCGEQANTWKNALDPEQRRQWAEVIAADRAIEEAGNSAVSPADLELRLLQTALTWFEAERETMVQAFDWAADTQQRQGSVALAANLAPFFGLRGYWGDWVSTHQQALIAARQSDDPRSEGQTLNNLGNVYKSQGKWNEAIAVYEQSLEIYRAIDDVHGKGGTLGNLGNVYQSQGTWNKAIATYEQSLQIKREIGDVHGEGATLNNLGNVYQSQSKSKEAIAAYEQSLQIFRAIGDVHGEGLSLMNFGNVYQSQGKWNEAIAVYEQSLQIRRALGDVHGEGISLMNLGIVYGLQGKLNEAITTLEQSLQTFRVIGDVHGEGKTLNSLGSGYTAQGKWNEAIAAYEQSLQIFRAIGDVPGEGATLNNLGMVYSSQNKWNEAIAAYERSLQSYRTVGDVHSEGQTLANLGNVYGLQKHLDQAVDCWHEALTKLHPDFPEHATVAQWLQSATQSHRPAWIGWLLPLGILLFLAWNLVNGHWLIALLGGIALVGWQWQRRRRR
jgi:tetratricopeptide (TPR) repeat protein